MMMIIIKIIILIVISQENSSLNTSSEVDVFHVGFLNRITESINNKTKETAINNDTIKQIGLFIIICIIILVMSIITITTIICINIIIIIIMIVVIITKVRDKNFVHHHQ